MRVKKKDTKNQLTIKEVYESFNEEKIVQGIGKVNDRNYWGEINDFLKKTKLNEDDSITKINQNTVNQYILSLRTSSQSLGSVNHYIRSIRVFLYYCMRNNLLDTFKIHLVKCQEEGIKYCSDEEVKELLKVKNKDNFVEMRTYTIICFILSTGCRSSTLCNIKHSDINFKDHTVIYRHLKNKKVCIIPLSPQIEKILKKYIQTWETNSEWLFCDIKGEQMTVNSLKLSLSRYSKSRKLRRIGPHSLRHTFSRQWIINGGNPFILQQFLTHSDLTMTRRYVKLFSKDIVNSGFEKYIPFENYSNNLSRTKTITKRNS